MGEDRSTRARVAIAAGTVLVVLAVGAGSCSDDDDSAKVDVTLSEFIVEPDPASAGAGEVEIVGDNQGGETHELVMVKAADAAGLPVDEDGAVVEDDLPEGAFVGEIEDIEAQSSKSVTFDLEAGDYVLFCNITEEDQDSGEIESHFAEGMNASFTVE